MSILYLALASFPAFAGNTGQRPGEIGVQIGGRLADSDIIPDGDNGLAVTYGIEGAWAFSPKWALFWDANTSQHNSKQFCAETPNCSALTPTSRHKVVTFGMERRLKQNARGGQWVFGLGTGIMDIDWNGTQIHHPILSFNVGRRCPLGPGTLRWTFRIETSVEGKTDPEFYGALDRAIMTNVVAVVGWGFDFGRRSKTADSVPAGPDPSSTAIADPPGS